MSMNMNMGNVREATMAKRKIALLPQKRTSGDDVDALRVSLTQLVGPHPDVTIINNASWLIGEYQSWCRKRSVKFTWGMWADLVAMRHDIIVVEGVRVGRAVGAAVECAHRRGKKVFVLQGGKLMWAGRVRWHDQWTPEVEVEEAEHDA